jgi:amino acid transporter
MDTSNRNGSGQGRFGTFGGVFTPCTLTILGVIMFLRFGHVVGQSGLVNAIIIVLLAKLITTLTTFSLSSIATNTRVKGGGAYFLISRSLGAEFGGAIGVVLFLAQAISVALYVIGFTEAFLVSFPRIGASPRVVSTVVNVLVFASVFIGAGWTIKVQYGILAALGVSLVSFYIGAGSSFSMANLSASIGPDYLPGDGFFTMFALFFPAATGIMAGVNMSGDLKEPGKSIPWGTLAAIGATALVYLSLAILLAGSASRVELLGEPLIMKDIAVSSVLVMLGIFAATLSSGLGSMMGAPRILQALARDNIFRFIRPLRTGSGENNEPRRATIATFVIAQSAILLGSLDVIAPIITMFFMLTYATLNLATFLESYTKNPSYRPRFRLSHWSTALLGALGCLAVMVLISPIWAAVAIVTMVGLHRHVSRKKIRARWGDVKSGVAFERARQGLLRLEDERYHPKNWRPVILALSGSTWNRINLVVYAHWLTAGHGVLSLANIMLGDVEKGSEQIAEQEKQLRQGIRDLSISAFPVVTMNSSLLDGIRSVVLTHGIGGVRPNTVLTGWTRDPDRYESFGATIRTVAALNRSVIALRSNRDLKDPWSPPPGTVDVWWRGKDNGALMLLLAHLLVENDVWRSRRIRLLRAIGVDETTDDAMEHLRGLIELSRIDAEPVVIRAERPADAIRVASCDAAVAFLGMRPPVAGSGKSFVESMNDLSLCLDTVIFVSSSGDASLDA